MQPAAFHCLPECLCIRMGEVATRDTLPASSRDRCCALRMPHHTCRVLVCTFTTCSLPLDASVPSAFWAGTCSAGREGGDHPGGLPHTHYFPIMLLCFLVSSFTYNGNGCHHGCCTDYCAGTAGWVCTCVSDQRLLQLPFSIGPELSDMLLSSYGLVDMLLSSRALCTNPLRRAGVGAGWKIQQRNMPAKTMLGAEGGVL